MQCKPARPVQGSVNLANLGLLEFSLVRGLGAGHTIQNWAEEWGIRFEYIQPGKPQQNAYVERFNRTVRYEWLSQYYWSSIEEVQDFATQWMWSYNHDRPNMALGGFTPMQHLAMAA
jgi:putative transposase